LSFDQYASMPGSVKRIFDAARSTTVTVRFRTLVEGSVIYDA